MKVREYLFLTKSALEAFAVGDAIGMVTEFMSREEIRKRFGFVDRFLNPEKSLIHSNLFKAQITDDTEQLLYCIRSYAQNGVSLKSTVNALLLWYKEKDPISKGYIGPSTKKSIDALIVGKDPETTGLYGTTCGGAMRVASVCFFTKDIKALPYNIYACVAPTHNTNIAMEGAFSYGYAVYSALHGGTFEEIIALGIKGGIKGQNWAKNHFIGASTVERIKLIYEMYKKERLCNKVLDFIYQVIGTGTETNEVIPAVFGIFMISYKNPWKAIRLSASLGGDTDTISALVGLLSTLYCKGHNIPRSFVEKVGKRNKIDFLQYAKIIWRAKINEK